MPPVDFEKFKKMVKAEGCEIVEKTKHRSLIYKQEIFVSDFSITHRKGAKDMVLPCYQKTFLIGLANANKTLEENGK